MLYSIIVFCGLVVGGVYYQHYLNKKKEEDLYYSSDSELDSESFEITNYQRMRYSYNNYYA